MPASGTTSGTHTSLPRAGRDQPRQSSKHAYYGTKRIEAKRSVLKFGEIANEIIQRLEADSGLRGNHH